MPAKLPTGSNPIRITDVLGAYFQLDSATQQEIQKRVERLSDMHTSDAERARTEQALAADLLSVGGKLTAGPEEPSRLSFHDLRARMDKAEVTFAATLARLMAERRLTQAELAERIGVGQSAIAMMLKRRCRPQRRTLGKLAEAFGVPVEELWPGFSTGWRSGVI